MFTDIKEPLTDKFVAHKTRMSPIKTPWNGVGRASEVEKWLASDDDMMLKELDDLE